MTPQPVAKKNYRPDIDGLRGIAVLGVVIFHSGIGISGGYAGVDVFFVISGFLITGILLKDLERGSFSMRRFWERRARRILPALTVTVIATLIAGWFLLFPQSYLQMGRSVVALSLFSSNVNFWLEDGYFGEASESKPLLHTWSLSVEEQFYLVAPILFWILFKIGRKRTLGPIVSLGFLASLGLSVWAGEQIQYFSANFFLLPTRAWELLAGSLLALAPVIGKQLVREASALAGLGLIVFSFWWYTPETPFPGYAAMAPVFGAALLIWSGNGNQANRPLVLRLLSMRPLVFVGLVSYSFYLIHWPFFAFHYSLFGKPPGLGLASTIIIISFCLSVLSWRYVENPFRGKSLLATPRGVLLTSSAAIGALILSGLVIVQGHGFEDRFSPDVLKIVSGGGAERKLPEKNMRIADIPDGLIRFGTRGAPTRVFLWGDSHANAVMPGVAAACRLPAGGCGRTCCDLVGHPAGERLV